MIRGRWIPGLAAIAVLAGCASMGTSSSTPGSTGSPAAPVAATSAAICTTNSCIASDLDQSLIGLVAKDEAVVTKAVCKPSTVKRNPGPTWTATCTVTESDGNTATGYANLVTTGGGTVTWDPQKVISGPDAG